MDSYDVMLNSFYFLQSTLVSSGLNPSPPFATYLQLLSDSSTGLRFKVNIFTIIYIYSLLIPHLGSFRKCVRVKVWEYTSFL